MSSLSNRQPRSRVSTESGRHREIVASVVILAWLVVVSNGASAQHDPLPPGVGLNKTGAGEYIVANGKSLYWTDRDVIAGAATCIGECSETWRPMQAPPDAKETGDWSVHVRADGIRQWMFGDKPLYTYVQDTFPDARLGDGRGRVWHVLFEPIEVPAAMTIQSTLLGRVLADHRGRTLYAQTSITADGQEANTDASGRWQVFAAPALAIDRGDWAVETYANGIRQWTYKDQKLFTYAKDSDPQDIRGHGLADTWSAVILEPAPSLPSWVTAERIDLGLAYANEDGMTLYAPADFDEILAAQTCPAECIREFWRPVLANSDEHSMGRWVILENAAGQRQWSYDGRLLFTHTRDRKPGDMIGHGHAVGYRIGGGWRVILVETRLRARG